MEYMWNFNEICKSFPSNNLVGRMLVQDNGTGWTIKVGSLEPEVDMK